MNKKEKHGSEPTKPVKVITLDEILAKDIAEKVFEKNITKIQKKIDSQEKISWNIVLGVVLAFVLSIGVIIIEQLNSRDLHSEKFNFIDNQNVLINNKIRDHDILINNIKNDIENIKIRNPYLN
ncbi:MAG: hypothetical protein KAR54_02585 [Candidatus Pacebacteria bacterium]|nr:hypothetical protein [Candidatus Paceibacterota bacterium]